MRPTPSKMRMNDMVTIDTIVFEIVRGGGHLEPPPHGLLAFSNSPDQNQLATSHKLIFDKIVYCTHSHLRFNDKVNENDIALFRHT